MKVYSLGVFLLAALPLLHVAALAERPVAEREAGMEPFASSDETVTAKVKSKLATNANTKDLRIDVDTKNGVVKLSGEVWSATERDLAGLLARNIEAVAMVRNELVVRGNR